MHSHAVHISSLFNALTPLSGACKNGSAISIRCQPFPDTGRLCSTIMIILSVFGN